ncbi:MAG: tyrosine-type recombinase/integrase [Anaerolineae bacterium]|nr:tyrosine-type recombinase/integrase [Anaerolineae bacterium]
MKLEEAIRLFVGKYDKPSTRRAYHQVLTDMALRIGAGRPVERITTVDLLIYVQEIKERGLKHATEYKYIKTMRTFFNWLVRIKVIPESPVAAVENKRPARSVGRNKAMTDEELAILESYVLWKPRDLAILLFLADTGCRAGGAAHLRLQDLDLDNLKAMVTEKGDKTRPVWFGERTATALRKWLLKRGPRPHDYVFCGDNGPLLAASISQVIRRASYATETRSLGSHSLRHRKGFQLADARVAVTVAATALGHENPMTTMENYWPNDYERAEQAIRELVIKPEEAAPSPNIIPLKKTR